MAITLNQHLKDTAYLQSWRRTRSPPPTNDTTQHHQHTTHDGTASGSPCTAATHIFSVLQSKSRATKDKIHSSLHIIFPPFLTWTPFIFMSLGPSTRSNVPQADAPDQPQHKGHHTTPSVYHRREAANNSTLLSGSVRSRRPLKIRGSRRIRSPIEADSTVASHQLTSHPTDANNALVGTPDEHQAHLEKKLNLRLDGAAPPPAYLGGSIRLCGRPVGA
ncbi:hypothetical protein QBC34DRAFT_391863 [Podospora aff. communis PSN243]|uniref:Uncharacterized protein n=1 Tax=Podospora aff. communis PSN243 TaxID=3040156 RepID=A0AAV9H3R1_9PEZI|nr:hypothetical protein QBC34DRAFT_391863 [Podospora aff. communis PSN243]